MHTITKPFPATISVKFDEWKTGDHQWIMFSSDRHFDSVHCDRKLMKADLEKAKERNALIIDVGDMFDVMQGRYDPRRSYDDLRPEYKTSTYLDDIVEDAADFFKPYAENFLVIGRGNHDQTVLKNSGTDIISNLVYHLNRENNANIVAGTYGGWVKMLFNVSSARTSKNIKYFHGSGGDAPVTKGTIQTARQAVYLPDADIVVNGHSHNAYILPLERERISNNGRVYTDTSWYIRTPSYADHYGDGTVGWEVERWGSPKPRGCIWAKIEGDRNGKYGIISTEIYQSVI